jgi:hypothetical protein
LLFFLVLLLLAVAHGPHDLRVERRESRPCGRTAKREKNALKMAKAKGSQLGAQKEQKMRICKKCYTQV